MTRWHSPPAELYTLVEYAPATVLLESAHRANPGIEPDPRTRLFTDPRRICIARQSAELPQLFAEIEAAVAAGLYAAGYFTYECGTFFEPTAGPPSSRPGRSFPQPLAWIGIYDRCHLFDHRTGAFLDGAPPGLTQHPAVNPVKDSGPEPLLVSSLALTQQEYAQRVATIHEWIRSGDVYQLNFTVPLEVHAPGSSAALYRHLSSRQPVPYGAFLHCQPNLRILSFSPELFFHLENQPRGPVPHPGYHPERAQRVEGPASCSLPQGSESKVPVRRITTRPMKGTAPRGRTTAEDRAQAEWLRNDPKNRAENVMIVDLLRNDLGRLCAYATVRAENLFAVERYPTLWQMTSTVTGELRPEVNFRQIFRALFPCGSITGAPKVRAMQLIAQIEPQPRGVYTGAVGFFSRDQTVFNVAIRTLELNGERGRMGVGSGIVIDSNPAAEFRECLLKAEFLTRTSSRLPDSFFLVETLLWQGEYPRIELHLDRLQDSANYFGIPCDRAEAKAALLTHAAAFAQMSGAPGLDSETWDSEKADPHSVSLPQIPRKVRLLLDHNGALHIQDEPLPNSQAEAAPLRVRVAPQRTDPADPMLFHKTTHRPLYAEAFQAATQAGYDDVLFLNLRGEVTEGAIHNIFIEKDGRLFTPPIDSGLLPGVHRRYILETQSNVEERVLYPNGLRQADAIYLSNAVRGLLPAVIDWGDD